MPASTDGYRTVSRTQMRRAYMSLGLDRSAFSTGQPRVDARPFDAVCNADQSRPDGLWLFKGSEFYTYDLALDSVVAGPTPFRGAFGGDRLPPQFSTGIDGMVWKGPSRPSLWTMFRENWFYSADAANGWTGTAGPRGVLGAWSSGVWCNPDGTWRTPGVPLALHGVGAAYDGRIHFFKDGQYVRHVLDGGFVPEVGPVPVTDVFALPEPFAAHLDYAFYGTAGDEENINFISGNDYVLYDTRRGAVVDRRPVTQRFPAFVQFFRQPQLFLGEDYTLEVMVGAVHRGRLVDTRTVGAGSTITKLLVTETTDSTRTSVATSMLDSQDTSVSDDFYRKVDANTSSQSSTDRYRYQFDASFHGDASADSLWGGEVNAQLSAGGQTETLRTNLSDATFNSISSQLAESKRATQQRTYDSKEEISSTTRVLQSVTFEERNDSDRARVYDFFDQLQDFLTLLSLNQAVVAYADGVSRPEIAQLPGVRALLERVLADPATVEQVVTFLTAELSSVSDATGEVRSLLDPAGELKPARNLSSEYAVLLEDGTSQTVHLGGIVKAVRSWVEPTFTITPIQRDASA